jgi:hypothetical protein
MVAAMQARGQRALHPRQVVRVDPDETARIVALEPNEVADESDVVDRTLRHRRPTIRMSAAEIQRVVAETVATPARTRLARGSGEHEMFPPEDEPLDPSLLLLPFRARRPVLATFITVAFAAAILLAIHHIIAAG